MTAVMHFEMLSVLSRVKDDEPPELKLWNANVGTCMSWDDYTKLLSKFY